MPKTLRTSLGTSLAALAAFVVVASGLPLTSASFTSGATSQPNAAGTDALYNHFSFVPGTAVQPGTSTPIASGSDAGLAIDLGRVPDTRTIADVVRVTNITGSSRSLDLSLIGVGGGIAGLEFSDGTTSKSLAAGAMVQLRVRTSAATAGSFSGSARLQATGDGFLRLDRPIASAQAPTPASGLAAAAADGTAHVPLSWTASTASGVAGYNVYRATSAGGTYSKVNASPVSGTTYDDTSAALGANYWYAIRSVAGSVTPELDGLDSNIVQAAVLTQPTSVTIPAGASNNAGYVTLTTRASVTFQVVVPAGTAAGDTVALTVTSGANTLNLSQVATGGAQTLSFTGNNLTAWADAAITLSARVTRGGFSGPATAGSGVKDVVVPAAPTAASTPATAASPVNYVNSTTAAGAVVRVTSGAGATDTVEARLTSGAASVTGSAMGAATANVTVVATSLADTAVGGLAVAARRVDQAGNPSTWFAGTAATKDTVAPANPNRALITFTNRIAPLADRAAGAAGAISNNAQVRVFDYFNNTLYGSWTTGTGTGSFATINIANAGVPRTLGYESRDAAWNQTARVCVSYAGTGTGASVTCP